MMMVMIMVAARFHFFSAVIDEIPHRYHSCAGGNPSFTMDIGENQILFSVTYEFSVKI
jgi:hypothetical protein